MDDAPLSRGHWTMLVRMYAGLVIDTMKPPTIANRATRPRPIIAQAAGVPSTATTSGPFITNAPLA